MVVTHTAMRADAMLEKGDLDGYLVFKRVVKAAEEFLSKERPDGATLIKTLEETLLSFRLSSMNCIASSNWEGRRMSKPTLKFRRTGQSIRFPGT